MNIADALIPKTYASGDIIIQQGDSADGMFFLEMGICEVYVESGAGNRKKVNFDGLQNSRVPFLKKF